MRILKARAAAYTRGYKQASRDRSPALAPRGSPGSMFQLPRHPPPAARGSALSDRWEAPSATGGASGGALRPRRRGVRNDGPEELWVPRRAVRARAPGEVGCAWSPGWVRSCSLQFQQLGPWALDQGSPEAPPSADFTLFSLPGIGDISSEDLHMLLTQRDIDRDGDQRVGLEGAHGLPHRRRHPAGCAPYGWRGALLR